MDVKLTAEFNILLALHDVESQIFKFVKIHNVITPTAKKLLIKHGINITIIKFDISIIFPKFLTSCAMTILSPTRPEALQSRCESDREEAEDTSHLGQLVPIFPSQSSVTVKVAKKFWEKKKCHQTFRDNALFNNKAKTKKFCLEHLISLN